MANYRVDIELAVQGSQQLKALTRDIQNVTTIVDSLNNYLETFGEGIARSYTNVSKAVNNASQALDSAVIGTQEATAAAYQLVRAEQELNDVIAQREKLLRKVALAGKPTAGPVGGFPVEGPQVSPGFQATQKSIGKLTESLALGAGFPLLFGGGAGSIAGSVLGSFFGTGFGGQILGGALGQALDQAIQKAGQLGSALQQLSISALEESGYRVNSSLRVQVELLKQIGDIRSAQVALEQDILATTGALPGTVGGISDAVNLLNSAWNETVIATSTLLGIVGAPFAAALAAILNAVNLIIKGINVAFSAVGAVLKTVGEFVVKLVAGDDAVKRINDGLKANNQELEKARALYAEILATNNAEILLNRQIINLEQQRTAGRTEGQKLQNAQIDYQIRQAEINKKYDDAKLDINKKLNENNKALVQEQLRQNETLRKQALELEGIKATRAASVIIATEQEKRDREAAQAAEQQRKELERIAKLRVKQLSDAQDAYALADADRAIAGAMTDESKLLAEFDKERVRRMIDFRELYNKSLSDKEREALIETQYLRAVTAQIEYENKLTDIQKDRTKELYAQLGAMEILNTKTQTQLADVFGGYTDIPFDLKLDVVPGITDGKVGSELERVRKQLEDLIEPAKQVSQGAESIGKAFSDSFIDTINGSISAQQAMANFFQNTANSFLNMAAQMIAKYIQMQLIGLAASFFPGGGLFKGAGPYQFGGGGGTAGLGFSSGLNLMGRAGGGPVSAGTPYLVGERGPELFMPRTSGSIYPNDAMGVGGSNIVVNVDATGTNVQGNSDDSKRLGEAIGVAIRQELIKQKRPGGLLA